MNLIYIDQNILGYLLDGTLSLGKIDGWIWVYSDEHFAEIERSGKLELLDCLDKIGARRIKILLDDKFMITNNWCLDNFMSANEIYNEYINSNKEPPKLNFDFNPLILFFAGNKDAIQLDNISTNFISAIKDLMKDTLNGLACNDIYREWDANIALIGREFESTLLEASENIKPILKLRKSLAGTDISNIDKTKGGVIDQIWEKISKKDYLISKDQFFGKKPFRGFGQDEVNPLFLSVVQCYIALNFLGYWPDSMSKISKIYGINSDASHVGHAAFCTALLSEDSRLCKKAAAIYQYFDIRTVVCHIQFSKSAVKAE